MGDLPIFIAKVHSLHLQNYPDPRNILIQILILTFILILSTYDSHKILLVIYVDGTIITGDDYKVFNLLNPLHRQSFKLKT